MFTLGAIILTVSLAWYAGRQNENDRSQYDGAPLDLHEWLLLLHARQDLKLISFLLGGILVMLGVIADRIQ
ncbi:hypothetical protein [Methylocystis sp.]|uniref:hypothetical protein n=1 Tax=Methylocystis sp. TaxID=1911079 RepID=UPI003D126500